MLNSHLKRISFSCYASVLLAIESVPALFDSIAASVWPSREVFGIRMVDTLDTSEPNFFQTVEAALSLIKDRDPRRFSRLKREIRLVVHLPVATGAQYSRLKRVCTVDLRHLDRYPWGQHGRVRSLCAFTRDDTWTSMDQTDCSDSAQLRAHRAAMLRGNVP